MSVATRPEIFASTLELLERLTAISSPSGDPAGLAAAAQAVKIRTAAQVAVLLQSGFYRRPGQFRVIGAPGRRPQRNDHQRFEAGGLRREPGAEQEAGKRGRGIDGDPISGLQAGFPVPAKKLGRPGRVACGTLGLQAPQRGRRVAPFDPDQPTPPRVHVGL